MRVVVRQQQQLSRGMIVRKQQEKAVDICSIEGWRLILDANPDLILLVTSEGCGKQCEVLKEAVDKVGEQMNFPVMELQFSKKAESECPSMYSEVRAEPGQVIVYRGGKEVGRRKGTYFAEQDMKNLKELLS